MTTPMIHQIRLFTALLVLGLAGPVLAQGDSGFLRGEGNLDIVVSYGLDTYDEFWIGEDKVTDPPFGRVYRHYVSVYAAYGLTDEMDLTLNGAYVYADTDELFEREHALQDLVVQLKARVGSFRLGEGSLNLLLAPAAKVPLSHYEDNAVTAVGDGQVDLRARGIVQYVFDNGAFFALETGYDFRFDAPPDELPVHLTAGFTPCDGITLTGFLSNIESLGGFDIGEGPFPGVEEEYIRVGGGIYWRITENFGLSANAWTTLDGKNTGDVDGFSIGGVFRF